MTLRAVLALVACAALPSTATAQQAPAPAAPQPGVQGIGALLARFSDDPDRFTQKDGQALYRATCQACHMEDGAGDSGAGAYPALTDANPKMMSKHFVAGVILSGYHGMPRFGHLMTDEQVAAVTDYVRSSLGNAYTDPITPAQVSALRPPGGAD